MHWTNNKFLGVFLLICGRGRAPEISIWKWRAEMGSTTLMSWESCQNWGNPPRYVFRRSFEGETDTKTEYEGHRPHSKTGIFKK